jgi:hypothetical protein
MQVNSGDVQKYLTTLLKGVSYIGNVKNNTENKRQARRNMSEEDKYKEMLDMMIQYGAGMTGGVTSVGGALPTGYDMPWNNSLREYVEGTPQGVLNKLPEMETAIPTKNSYAVQEKLKELVRNGQAIMDKNGFVRKVVNTENGVPLETVLGRILKQKGGI